MERHLLKTSAHASKNYAWIVRGRWRKNQGQWKKNFKLKRAICFLVRRMFSCLFQRVSFDVFGGKCLCVCASLCMRFTHVGLCIITLSGLHLFWNLLSLVAHHVRDNLGVLVSKLITTAFLCILQASERKVPQYESQHWWFDGLVLLRSPWLQSFASNDSNAIPVQVPVITWWAQLSLA